jgi:hypothetical protein
MIFGRKLVILFVLLNSHIFNLKIDYRTYALYKLTIMCMNDIWSFQALRMKSR